MCYLKLFFDKNSVIFLKMCLTFPFLTRCAWEPGSRFLHFVEVCSKVLRLISVAIFGVK